MDRNIHLNSYLSGMGRRAFLSGYNTLGKLLGCYALAELCCVAGGGRELDPFGPDAFGRPTDHN